MIKISVVIPIFNESAIISELIIRIKNNLEKITKDFEIIFVDDGSIDSTWEKINIGAISDQRIKGIRFSRNFGQHYALTAGISNTVGDWVVVMDGDLQDRPEVIPALYAKAQEGYDVVFVSRKNRPEKIYYKIMQKIFYSILRFLSGMDFDSSQANFSIINRKVADSFNRFPENARFYGSTIKWLGYKRTQIFADHGKRYSGTPSYTLRRRIKLALDIILAFSDRPLKLAIILGAMISTLSIVMSIWVIYRYLKFGFSITGWTSIILSIIFSTGAIIFILGIVGIYIGQIFLEVKRRPLYIAQSTVNLSQSN